MLKNAKKNALENIYKVLVYILPAVLFFSFYPWMNFGMNESMNFELSLPIMWLLAFAAVSLILIIKKKRIGEIFKNWRWLLFPIFMTVSLFWTYDLLRGVLIGGVLWLIYFAGLSFYLLRDEITGDKFWKNFFRVLLGTSLFVCFWCLLQCVFDVLGMERGYSLTCAGCTYKIFGFPHPNGFAAEPQFMGNLLLAPIVMTIYLLIAKKFFTRKFLIICLFVFISTLFLTLSRGAIYSFAVGLIFFTAWWIIKERRWQILSIWVLSFSAFLFTLNLQGIFSEISPTNDTYISGVSKVVNQLTLGIIDIGGSQVKKDSAIVDTKDDIDENIVNENETIVDETITNDAETAETAIFDGYIEISTNARTSAWQAALKTWAKDPETIMFGVGLGGALKGMYESGNFHSSKEIINNQYVSILLEGGIIGVLLLVVTLVLLFRVIYKMRERIFIFTLAVMYMVSLVFFSGLPNALHIYLLFAVFVVMFSEKALKARNGKS